MEEKRIIFLKEILTEMCSRVNADYSTIDFMSDYWYESYAWTEDEQSSFVEWLTDYIYSTKDVYKCLSNNPNNKTKEKSRVLAEEFIFNYGWTNNFNLNKNDKESKFDN